jgi:hypothetical protein
LEGMDNTTNHDDIWKYKRLYHENKVFTRRVTCLWPSKPDACRVPAVEVTESGISFSILEALLVR